MLVLQDGPAAGPLIILAHGAGAGADSDFMQQLATGLATHGCSVLRFEFPYMTKRREDGKKRPPDRAPKLLQAFAEVVAQQQRPCVIAGKSMGGRMATMLACDDQLTAAIRQQIKGVAALGYPFHPPGKPESLRTAHLQHFGEPLFIAQGTRDALGSREEVAGYPLDAAIQWLWLEDGNHDLKPRKASGYCHQDHINAAIKGLADFAFQCLA